MTLIIQQSKDKNCSKRTEIVESVVESHYMSKIHILAQKYRRMSLIVPSRASGLILLGRKTKGIWQLESTTDHSIKEKRRIKTLKIKFQEIQNDIMYCIGRFNVQYWEISIILICVGRQIFYICTSVCIQRSFQCQPKRWIMWKYFATGICP